MDFLTPPNDILYSTFVFQGTPFGIHLMKEVQVLINNITKERERDMPNQGNNRVQFKVKFDDTYFAKDELSDDEMDDFDVWVKNPPLDLGEYLNRSIDMGDKISISIDEYNQCITGSCTIRDPNSPSYGAVITCRSMDCDEVLWLLIYKRHHVLDLSTGLTARRKRKRG